MSSLDEILSLCETRIAYQFQDRTLLRRCLTHSSSAETRLDSNERLEFLGDAVLGLMICEYLFQLFPGEREGQLTQMKSNVVSRQTCARVARLLDLQELILVGRGLQSMPESILAAVVESLIAGVYLDGGPEAARQFILYGFREELSLCGPIDTENYKSQLQEYTQREFGTTPEYIVVEESGPDHAREFGISARIGESVFDIGRGKSKKEAEQQAARNAILTLQPANAVSEEIFVEDGSITESVVVEMESVVIVGETASEFSTEAPNDDGFGAGIIDETGPHETDSVQFRTILSVSHTSQHHRLKASPMNSVKSVQTEVLYRPETAELRFLPEGPYSLGDGSMSWVSIQHGADAKSGSLNVLDLATRTNRSFNLPGRPGFAFPTDRSGVFVAGLERSVGLFDTTNDEWRPFIEGVEASVSNTIINDAVVFEGNLIFGCKDPEFKTPKAGLYLWRRSDGATIRLRDNQICSNGKAIVRNPDGTLTLFDIDSATGQITRCELDIDAGRVGKPVPIVDLTPEKVAPDGMILTPDRKSLIVAVYDPGNPSFGVARQHAVADGSLEAIWTCPGSPRITCPQLVRHEGRVLLVLTSAVENMPDEQLSRYPNAGCLFVGETSFESTGDQPVFACP